MDFKIINCTPHKVSLLMAGGSLDFKPSSNPARVISCQSGETHTHGIHINHRTKGVIENLPKPEHNTLYIVSQLIAQQATERTDLIYPDDLVRNKDTGEIIGTKSFAQIKSE